ncbi:MAG: hypothetical protein MJE66_09520 [Proteobacteria bacterium]|nr:hypothetical protein [Pseudomonadota bacterium]
MALRTTMIWLTILGVTGLGASTASSQTCGPEPQNVVFLLDTSASTRTQIWHPVFDPTFPASCNAFDPDEIIQFLDDTTLTACGRTRTHRVDPALQAEGIETRFDGRYLNWRHSPESDPYAGEIEADLSGELPECLGGGAYGRFRQSRLSAAKLGVRDIICRITTAADPRIGLARLRLGGGSNGGYIRVPVQDESPAHLATLEAELDALVPLGASPMGEALFQIYTYFMSRTELPVGVDGVTNFPAYEYSTSDTGSGGPLSPSPPPSPVGTGCAQNIVVVYGDGAPTRDAFEPAGGTDLGFDDFQDLIGDFNPDNDFPEEGNELAPGNTAGVAYYLDDIALFMQERDFAPTLPGDQTVTIHTANMAPGDLIADVFLSKTASAGGGFDVPTEDSLFLAELILAAGPALPPCSNGLDDDFDGAADFPDDVGCRDANWSREDPACQDGFDNDGDGGTDWDGAGFGPPDPQCVDRPWRLREAAGQCGAGAELVVVVPLLQALARRRARRGRPTNR